MEKHEPMRQRADSRRGTHRSVAVALLASVFFAAGAVVPDSPVADAAMRGDINGGQ